MKLGRASSYTFGMSRKKIETIIQLLWCGIFRNTAILKEELCFQGGMNHIRKFFSSTSSFDLELFSTMNIDQTIPRAIL